MAELAVICADTQEVIGSAVALKLIFGMPVSYGVAFTILASLVSRMLKPGNPSFAELWSKTDRGYLRLVCGCNGTMLFYKLLHYRT